MHTRRQFISSAIGAGVALTVPTLARALISGSGPLAVVTADLESHVVVVEPTTGRVLQRIRTGPGPRSVEAALGTLAIVAHTTSGKVTIVHPYEPAASVVLRGMLAPRYTTVVDQFAYITDSAAHELVVIDLLSTRLISRASVPGPTRHVSASPDGDVIWTALGSSAERIAIIDIQDPKRPRHIRSITPPAPAHDVVFAPDEHHVWVTSGSKQRIWIYEKSGKRPIAELAADKAPQHIAWVGETAFVASGKSGTVHIHRPDGTQIGHASVPRGSYNISYGAKRAITPSLDKGTIALLDAHHRVRKVQQVARSAHDACILDPN